MKDDYTTYSHYLTAHFFLKGRENVLFELGSESVKLSIITEQTSPVKEEPQREHGREERQARTNPPEQAERDVQGRDAGDVGRDEHRRHAHQAARTRHEAAAEVLAEGCGDRAEQEEEAVRQGAHPRCRGNTSSCHVNGMGHTTRGLLTRPHTELDKSL